MPPRNCCLKCMCLNQDYCYGAFFNHYPEEEKCPDFEPYLYEKPEPPKEDE